MKKKSRIQPLQLSREALRQLDNDKLAHNDGGGWGRPVNRVVETAISIGANR